MRLKGTFLGKRLRSRTKSLSESLCTSRRIMDYGFGGSQGCLEEWYHACEFGRSFSESLGHFAK